MFDGCCLQEKTAQLEASTSLKKLPTIETALLASKGVMTIGQSININPGNVVSSGGPDNMTRAVNMAKVNAYTKSIFNSMMSEQDLVKQSFYVNVVCRPELFISS